MRFVLLATALALVAIGVAAFDWALYVATDGATVIWEVITQVCLILIGAVGGYALKATEG